MPALTNDIDIKEVSDGSLLRRYIHLPAGIYKDYLNWVPPVYIDERKFHNPKTNAALAYADVRRWMAFSSGKPAGRIMGIIHHKYNERQGEKAVRFFQLDCVNDRSVSQALINTVVGWGREKGMTQIIGPYGFSDKDPQGLQVEGFEHLPVIATPTNPPYLQQLVEDEGFEKKLDCVSYRINVPEQIPELYEKIHERMCRNNQLRLLEFTSKRQFKQWIIPVFRLVNETFTPLYGFSPMSETEMRNMAAQYMPVLDHDFVKVVVNGKNELVAFAVALPDMSSGIQKANGKVFPFGFIHMLSAARKATQLDMMIGAIKQSHRGIGLNVLMGTAILKAAIRRNFKTIDSHLVLETNTAMCGEYEKLGGKIYKRYRIYGKRL